MDSRYHTSVSPATVRILQKELSQLTKEPVEGFKVEPDTKDMSKWRVGIFGPPETIYQGGYFKAELRFPTDYPHNPPSLRFVNLIPWHPNVYKSGDVCISILHKPGGDEQSGEHPSERWNPTQSVRTILLSVISLLNEPNTSSPANVDASVAYRKWKLCGDKEYVQRIREQVKQSKKQAAKEGIVVPETVESYCVKPDNEESSPGGAADKPGRDGGEWDDEDLEDYYDNVLSDGDVYHNDSTDDEQEPAKATDGSNDEE